MSSTAFIPPLAVGFISGAAGALLVIFLNADPAPSPEPSVELSQTPALLSRIADLELLAQEQAVAIDALHLNRPTAKLQRESLGGPTREEFDQLLARLDGLMLEPATMAESASSDRLELAIAGALNQREEDARLERQRVMEEKRQAQIDNRVAYWANRLSLSDVQATRMGELMTSRDEAREDIRNAIVNGEMAKADAAEPWAQADEDYNSGLSGVLTPQQLEDMNSAGGRSK
jgi:hypothetical protein